MCESIASPSFEFPARICAHITEKWQELVRGTLGQIKLECGIYRKKAAADMYIPSSAHSKKLRQGIVKGEFLGFILLCSTEEEFDKA